MIPQLLPKVFTAFAILSVASAHIELSWPYPLRSKFNPDSPKDLIDYDMINPLFANGTNFPCKGYHLNTPRHPTAVWTAGQRQHISLMGPVTTKGLGAWNHGGGSCQLSLSYDNGKSFQVIHSMQGGCTLEWKYDFILPKDVANGDVLLGWSWFNLQGEAQMYMNCADITITGGSGSPANFQSVYPDIFVANVDNNCSTEDIQEKQEVVFKNPGKQVVFGGNITRFSPPTPDCP
ncbi:probable endoglucanase [Fusarium torulosum]|uniref:Probable endoglucanase n=1 Tax=Fusarium torulosum TaxID=33205 RepID=A0AAE8SPI7_9HYPO|nr:probable endoglucanase [Fusarium torulosum]